MFGLMQDRPLLIQHLIEHAALNHGDTEIVSRTGRGRHPPLHLPRRPAPRQEGGRGAAGAGHRARRPHRHAGLERLPPLRALLRHLRHGRGLPHHQSAAVPRADRLHRQPRRGPDPVRRPRTSCRWSRSCCRSSRRCATSSPMTDRAHLPAGLPDPQPAGLRGADRRQAGRLRHGRSSTSAPPRRSATPRARRATPRACSTHTARPCCTPMPPPCPTRSACRRARWCCRWCRCSTSTPGACPTARAMVGAKLVFPGVAARRREPLRAVRDEKVSPSPPACRPSGWRCCSTCRPTSSSSRPVKYAVIGGSAAPPAMIETFDREFGVEVLHAWGMSEMSPLGTVNHPKDKHAGDAQASCSPCG